MPFTPPITIASKGSTGYLSTFSIGSPLSPVAELKSFKLNLISVPEVPLTHLLSPNNTEEGIPGMIKPGTVDISGNFIGDTSQLAITTLAQGQTVFPFKALAPMQGSSKTYTVTGTGYITKYETGPFEINKPNEFSASIQLTGTYIETVA